MNTLSLQKIVTVYAKITIKYDLKQQPRQHFVTVMRPSVPTTFSITKTNSKPRSIKKNRFRLPKAKYTASLGREILIHFSGLLVNFDRYALHFLSKFQVRDRLYT